MCVSGLAVLAAASTSVAASTAAPAAVVVDPPTLLHGNGARLTWRRSADADFVRYDVHRGTAAGFALSDGTKIASIGDRNVTTFTDDSAKGSTTYYYKIVVVALTGSAATEVSAALPPAGTSKLAITATASTVQGASIGSMSSTASIPCANDAGWGASSFLYVGSDTTTWIFRSLLRFDLSEIPAKATVNSADLRLRYLATTNTDTGVRAHRVTQRWSEGSATNASCGAGQAGATWREAQPGVLWRTATATAAGGTSDAAYAPTAPATHTRPAEGWDTFNLKTMAQQWANGTPNLGLLLRQATESRTTASRVTYYSDDTATLANKPTLTVAWSDPTKVLRTQVRPTSPMPGETVSGIVDLTAEASAARGGASVKFLIDGIQVGTTDTSAPYAVTWNSATVPSDSHVLAAEVTDVAGTTVTKSHSFTVDNSPPPAGVAITAPAAGATVSGTVNVTATASDDKTGTKVVFSLDGSVVGTDTSEPYSFAWNTLTPLTQAYDGTHTLKVEAIDSNGNSTESAARTVTVSNNQAGQYQASYFLNELGNSSAAFELPPMIDTASTAVANTSEGSETGSGQTGTKSSTLDTAPSCDTCSTAGQQAAGGSGSMVEAPGDPVSPEGFQLDVDVTNTSNVAWRSNDGAAGFQVWYRWYTDAGNVIFEGPGNDYFPTTMQPGQTKSVPVTVEPPPRVNGAERARMNLRFDIYDSITGRWFAQGGNKPVDNPVIVNKKLGQHLGLERFWQYEQVATGAGSAALTNLSNGNLLWRWSPSATAGRGLATILDLTYNSLEEQSDSPAGENVSLNISGLVRFGSRLDIHPNKADQMNGRSNRYVRFVDGDGTLHTFTGALDWQGRLVWTEPAGVNIYLRATGSSDPRKHWALTRPDNMTYFFDVDGYPRLVEDANGNQLEFILEDTPPGQDPGGPKKRVTRILDAADRAYVVDYYDKDEAKGGRVRGNVQTITDHSGSVVEFDYYDDGNLLRLTQHGGTSPEGIAVADRSFVFTYTDPDGDAPAIADAASRVNPDPKTNQSTKLYSVRDPRGQETILTYWGTQPDPKNRWKLKSWTDRQQRSTNLTYDWANSVTTVDAALARDTEYTFDNEGRVTRVVDPLERATTVAWSADNKVSGVTYVPTGRSQSFTYNANGYLLSHTNEMNEKSTLTYDDRAVDPADVRAHWSVLKTRTLPMGTASAATNDFTWTFGADTRGNITKVTDPEGTRTATLDDFTTRYDYGAVGGSTAGLITAVTAPEGGVTRLEYHESGQPSKITDPLGNVTTFGYDGDSRAIWLQDPEHQDSTGADARSYRTYFDFDELGRLRRASQPKSTKADRGVLIWRVSGFDANDNVTKEQVPGFANLSGPPVDAPASEFEFDKMDRLALHFNPDTSVDPKGERTALRYDDAGRLVQVVSPKGVDTAETDYQTETTYDVLDRPTRSATFGSSVAEARYAHTCYDVAGDVIATVAPRAARDGVDCPASDVRFVTRMTYDPAHRLRTVTDPMGRQQRITYDANGRVTSTEGDIERGTTPRAQHTDYAHDQRGLVIGSTEKFTGTRSLATVYRYDQNGRPVLTASPRAVDAAGGAGQITTNSDFVSRSEYDQADRLVRELLPKAGADPQTYVHHSYDRNGRLASTSLPTTVADAGAVSQLAKSSFTHYDPGWIRTADRNANPALLYDYNALGLQALRLPAKPGTATGEWDWERKTAWTHTVDGMPATMTDRDGNTTRWTYDAHNMLATAFDPSGVHASWDRAITTEATRNGFDEATKVRHRKDGEATWTFSRFTFNEHGMPTQRLENGKEDSAGAQTAPPKVVNLTYDDSDFLTKQLNLGTTPGCDGDERIESTYWDTGWERSRDLWRGSTGCTADPNTWKKRQTTSWTHFDNGKLRTMQTKNGTGVVTESHDVGYETTTGRYEDGNRVTDTFTRQRASAASTCVAGSPCEAQHSYDARGKVTRHQLYAGNVVTYKLDEPAHLIGDDTIRAGNVTTEDKNGVVTIKKYQANRHIETHSATGPVSKTWYDDFGNVDCVTKPTGTRANCNGPRDRADANVLQEFTYDSLDRLLAQARYTGGGAPTDSSQYVLDALDRTIEETEDHASTTHDRTTDFSYLGLTSLLTGEVQTGGTDPRIKTYNYNVVGQRVSMTDQANVTGSTQSSYSYGTDVHGSVTQLLDDNGGVKASYGYDAYGKPDTADGAAGSLTTGDTNDLKPTNPYRYSGRRLDSGTAGTGQEASIMDMGARRYGLDTGRFLQEDMFSSALGDLGLSLDPLSQNRYALAGGNPVSNIEYDGHMLMADGGGGSTTSGGSSTQSSGESSTSADSTDSDQTSEEELQETLLDFRGGLLGQGKDTAKGAWQLGSDFFCGGNPLCGEERSDEAIERGKARGDALKKFFTTDPRETGQALIDGCQAMGTGECAGRATFEGLAVGLGFLKLGKLNSLNKSGRGRDPGRNVPALRQAYMDEVAGLADREAAMRAVGASSEDIARVLHAERRALGIKYKNLTPEAELARIYARNQEKYGDPLGPSIDYLVGRGKSWEDIIESAKRTGGRDLGY